MSYIINDLCYLLSFIVYRLLFFFIFVSQYFLLIIGTCLFDAKLIEIFITD